jgi:hypothetical protein
LVSRPVFTAARVTNPKRFLLEQPLEESASMPIAVIVNWPALLKKGAAP